MSENRTKERQPIEIAPWVPEAVVLSTKRYCEDYERLNDDFYENLQVLLSHAEMKPVWEKFRKLKASDEDLVDFESIILHVRRNWRYVKPRIFSAGVSGTYNVKQHLLSIANQTRKLADKISMDYPFLNELFWKHPEFSILENRLRTFSRIAENFTPSDQAENEVFPGAARFRKKNSERAEIIYFIRELSSFMRRVFKKPLHSTVADLANLYYASCSDGNVIIDETMVRKNTSDLG